MANNLPAKREETLRELFSNPALKKQVQLAIPKHMTVDRLLRVAMTAIRTNPKLMDCTPKSLMACLMGCAQLGLEPEPFLGQAYLVPFKNKMGQMEAQLIPGYRGYITLARRSGEVQSVSAQCVYTNDQFRLQYGLNEALDHAPEDGDRGVFKGAYVVFRYKDGSHSFDYMTKGQIDKIRERSKAKDSGPWITDYDEMAKKTVIRRHVKLAPLSIEMAKAAALEERAMIGDDQSGLIFGETEQPALIEGTQEAIPQVLDTFERLAHENGINKVAELYKFVAASAKATNKTEDELMAAACSDFPKFLEIYNRSLKKKKEREEMEAKAAKAKKKETPKDSAPPPNQGPFPEEAEQVDQQTGEVTQGNGEEDTRPNSTMILCPKEGEGGTMVLGYCRENCVSSMDCQNWKQ